MSDQGDDGSPESHGTYGGTAREDGGLQEEPSGAEDTDEADWAEKTETGGDAS